MDASSEFVNAIIATLRANSDVSAIVGQRVFDVRPINRHYPYITIGPSQAEPQNLDCLQADEETLQIDCWTRDSGRMNGCRTLTKAVQRALHLQTIDLTVNAASDIRVTQVRVFPDSDENTTHGVVTVSGMIETASS